VSPHGLTSNNRISAPHRQSGNSVDPGTNKFSSADITVHHNMGWLKVGMLSGGTTQFVFSIYFL
jgi:hypothetical protein